MKTPIKFSYSKEMEPAFKAGMNKFFKETRITPTGIEFKIIDNSLTVIITQEQEEQWLFHMALCIGIEFQKMNKE